MALDLDLTTEVQKLNPSAIIDLYEISIFPEITSDPQYEEPFRFHSGVNGVDENITWQEKEFTRSPVEITGFESNTKGTIARPTFKIANLGGAISPLLYEFDNLIGAKVTRKRTLYKYLDAVNFPNNYNPDANPDVGFEDEIYYVSRKVVENGIYVELELSPSWDLQGIKIPRRLCTQNICMWQYKGLECGYKQLPELVKTAQDYTALPTTGVTVTSLAHKLQVGNAAYLNFTSGTLVGFSGVYNVVEATPNTFTVFVNELGSTTSGKVDISNRFTIRDIPIFDTTQVSLQDRCSKRLSSCTMRYGPAGLLPYGAFPAVGWIR